MPLEIVVPDGDDIEPQDVYTSWYTRKETVVGTHIIARIKLSDLIDGYTREILPEEEPRGALTVSVEGADLKLWLILSDIEDFTEDL